MRVPRMGLVALVAATLVASCTGNPSPTPTSAPPPSCVVTPTTPTVNLTLDGVSVTEVLQVIVRESGITTPIVQLRKGQTVEYRVGNSTITIDGNDPRGFIRCADKVIITEAADDPQVSATEVAIWYLLGYHVLGLAMPGIDSPDRQACAGGYIAQSMPGFNLDQAERLRIFIGFGQDSALTPSAMAGVDAASRGERLTFCTTR